VIEKSSVEILIITITITIITIITKRKIIIFLM
jgi:hypothetical protein